jgi:hypothetical protein
VNKKTKWTFFASGILIAIIAAFLVGRAWAGGAPTTKALVYSGLLQNDDGSAFAGAGHNIELKIWNSPTASTLSGLVCDTSSVPLSTDSTGHFSLSLGDDCAAGIAANSDAYVEILLDGSVLGGTRAKLGAVPYALEATHAVEATHAASADTASGALKTTIDALTSCPDSNARALYGFCIWLANNGQNYSQT